MYKVLFLSTPISKAEAMELGIKDHRHVVTVGEAIDVRASVGDIVA